MSLRSTPPITLPEYERMFRTIHAVLLNEGGDPSKACLFFAIAGAYLLSHHHKLKAVCPVAGVAAYNLRTPSNFSIIFGTRDQDKIIADAQHFHCWIEAEGWVIDLCAPLFDAMAPAEKKGGTLPACMFQKPLIFDAGAVSLETPGAYLHIPNDRLTTSLMKGFGEKAAYADLVRICDQWYVRPPKKIAPKIGIEDQAGEVTAVALSPVRLEGAW